ncbi:transporter substrate-binding protein [Yinghuangia aomiensis]
MESRRREGRKLRPRGGQEGLRRRLDRRPRRQGHHRLGATQHVYKTARIGVVQSDGQIKEVWSSGGPIKPDPYLKEYPLGSGALDPVSAMRGDAQ